MKRIILASNSPRRKGILLSAGFEFDVEPSDFKEDMTLNLTPHELVKHLSEGKAKDVANKQKQLRQRYILESYRIKSLM